MDTLFDIRHRCDIMGIINITPDSFYPYSRCHNDSDISGRIKQMLTDGADIIDLGGMSTRPGCTPVSEKEEYDRVIGAIKLMRKFSPDTILSVDTFRHSIAEAACDSRCDIINDISGGIEGEKMFEIVAKHKTRYVLTHSYCDKNGIMQPHIYGDIIDEMCEFFESKIKLLNSFGIEGIIIDPGFGFSKSMEDNYKVMANLKAFKQWNYPLLVGISRKTMIFRLLDCSPDQALNGTTVLNTIAIMQGADILRVHDIIPAMEARTICEAIVDTVDK